MEKHSWSCRIFLSVTRDLPRSDGLSLSGIGATFQNTRRLFNHQSPQYPAHRRHTVGVVPLPLHLRCDAKPLYGLPGAMRAVYCFSHKKGSMVRVPKEALDAQKHGGKKISTAPAAVESSNNKKKRTPAAALASEKKKATVKKARRGPRNKAEDDACAAGLVGEESVEKDGHGKPAGGAAKERRGTTAAAAAAAALAPASATDISNSTAAVSTKQALPLPPPSSVSRLADTSGMSPSAEILVIKQAREAAKKEAEASGGGRRPRAPSRRALEASGRMKGGGAQWMTREKKAEEDRVKKELREQRRQYRAAGLNVGVVIEAFVAPATGGAAGGGNGGGCSAGRETEAVRDEPGWQKVPPALLVASPPPPSTEQNKIAPAAIDETGKAC